QRHQQRRIGTAEAAMADKLLGLHRSIRRADPHHAVRPRYRMAAQPRRRRRIDAGKGEAPGRRDEHEIARLEQNIRLAICFKADPPRQHHAIEDVLHIVAPQPERTGGRGQLGKGRLRAQQRDDLGERIGHFGLSIKNCGLFTVDHLEIPVDMRGIQQGGFRMNTVMITGCSSGFGLETARHFLDRGWSVVATMRKPDAGLLPASERLRLVALDVTDRDSIARAVAEAGPIDALVNNAGIGWLSTFEGTSETTIRRLFETNTLGSFAVIRAVLPQMRDRGAGVIVNVSSSVTMKPLSLLSVYTASKAALNAYTECLALELAPLGIRTRLVLPGQAPATRFGVNAMALMAEAEAAPE